MAQVGSWVTFHNERGDELPSLVVLTHEDGRADLVVFGPPSHLGGTCIAFREQVGEGGERGQFGSPSGAKGGEAMTEESAALAGSSALRSRRS